MGIAELINKEKKTAFYYNQKINCMPAKGKMEYDGKGSSTVERYWN